MSTEVKKNESLEDKVVTAVAETASELPDTATDEDNEKLDARAELFVRRVSDSVTKAIADLVKPAPSEPVVPIETDTAEVKKRKKKVQAKLTILDWLLS